MGKLGKFLVGCSVIGAAAAGVYYYLEKTSGKASADADSQTERTSPIDVEAVKEAADRAYTTIRHGTDETIAKVKEAIGPKGEEVAAAAQETAEKVKEAAEELKEAAKDAAEEVVEFFDDEK